MAATPLPLYSAVPSVCFAAVADAVAGPYPARMEEIDPSYVPPAYGTRRQQARLARSLAGTSAIPGLSPRSPSPPFPCSSSPLCLGYQNICSNHHQHAIPTPHYPPWARICQRSDCSVPLPWTRKYGKEAATDPPERGCRRDGRAGGVLAARDPDRLPLPARPPPPTPGRRRGRGPRPVRWPTLHRPSGPSPALLRMNSATRV